MTQTPTQPHDQRQLDAAMLNLSEISRDLEKSYTSLARRARSVEDELCLTNAKLEGKVAELDAVNAHLEAILSSLPTGVIVRDARQRIIKVNDAACAILGYTSEDLLGRNDIPELPEANSESGLREIAAHDGRRLVIASRVSPVADGDACAATGSVEILDDRTELARMNKKVHQLDKMAALGTMAGGIAHELRNPMNAVLGFASLLKRSMETDGKQARWAERICDGVFEADAIITSLLTFADPERLSPETVRARPFLAEVEAMITRDLSAQLDNIELHFETDAIDFVADRVMLRQAIRNLTANAVQAQPDGGRVIVSLNVLASQVEIQVTDDGPGIPAELAQRVTEPFYTTRADGTGLGLPLVHTVAEMHGGSLEIIPDPAPPTGARITLRFPQDPR
ncbi:MAG: signal transduction histidine kinase [Chlamydiales bacterium]